MNVVVAYPRYSEEVIAGSRDSWLLAVDPDGPHVRCPIEAGGSFLPSVFNSMWGAALDHYEKVGDEHVDAFSMIHSDVVAPAGWVDVLEEEREKRGLDIISAVIAIKDGRRLTSTAVDDTGSPWRVRRLAMDEINKLPETFTDEDVGGPLLLNTGLWLCKLGPWATEPTDLFFNSDARLVKLPGPDGTVRRVAQAITEDWDFSRRARARGARLGATRKVEVRHYGFHGWDNRQGGGWSHDRQNAPRATNGQTVLSSVAQAAGTEAAQ